MLKYIDIDNIIEKLEKYTDNSCFLKAVALSTFIGPVILIYSFYTYNKSVETCLSTIT